jgi:uncharacterized protein YndB with AHSA1/START domain
VESTTERLAITRELLIDASPETVWEFLVDPEKIVRWKGVDAALQLWAGGAYRVAVLPEHVVTGEVVEADPPRRLVHTWGWEGSDAVPPGSTTVEYELVAEGDGTRLRFTHRDLPSGEEAGKHTHGWDHYLPRLALVAAGGDPGVDPWLTEGVN